MYILHANRDNPMTVRFSREQWAGEPLSLQINSGRARRAHAFLVVVARVKGGLQLAQSNMPSPFERPCTAV